MIIELIEQQWLNEIEFPCVFIPMEEDLHQGRKTDVHIVMVDCKMRGSGRYCHLHVKNDKGEMIASTDQRLDLPGIKLSDHTEIKMANS